MIPVAADAVSRISRRVETFSIFREVERRITILESQEGLKHDTQLDKDVVK